MLTVAVENCWQRENEKWARETKSQHENICLETISRRNSAFNSGGGGGEEEDEEDEELEVKDEDGGGGRGAGGEG